MTEGAIPVNPGDIPIDSVALEESAIYTIELRKLTVSPKPDKNGNVFCQVQSSVAEGDYEGQPLSANYIPMPQHWDDSMSKSEQIRRKNLSVAFGRMCRTFKIDTPVPPVNLGNPDSLRAFQEWGEYHYGKLGKCSVKNQEFPEGSGRLRSSISDFVF